VPRREVASHPAAPPRGLPPEWVVGAMLTLLGAAIIMLVATGELRVDLIP
jgi:hypothetical protein